MTAASFQFIAAGLAEFGDIFRVGGTRGQTAYVINHPDYIKHVLVKNHKNYTKGAGIDRVKILLGNGIFVSEGAHWHKQRKRVQPAFHRFAIARWSEVVRRHNDALLARWRQEPDGTRVNITAATSRLTLDIILEILFGEDLPAIVAGDNPFSVFIDDSARDLQLALKFRQLRRLVLDVIDRRRRRGGTTDADVLGILLQDRRGDAMSDTELVDELMTLIVAGHETTASSLNWTWYLLASHPQVEQGLHAELDATGSEHSPALSDLVRLPYARRVIDEAMRLYPPGWLFTRRAQAADQLGSYYVPAGTDLFISPYFLHRHTQFWPQPETFDPQRFTPAQEAARHRYAYIPFGAGPRRCIGDSFAVVEMLIHLAATARSFRLQRVAREPAELAPEVNLRTREPLYFQRIHR